MRNVFACLAHENEACVIDLVRNLHALDSESRIILYNGGEDESLLRRFPFERYGAIAHPRPQRVAWGRLHGFAIDCMELALGGDSFDCLTIVDSDQLAIREGYSSYLTMASGTGMLCNSPDIQPMRTRIGPAAVAWRELELWRPFLRRFPDGESHYPHWSFWPSSVFSGDAARELVRLFRQDAQLGDIVSRSAIWASEEVILPTLTALLGFQLQLNPCSYDFVKYRVRYSIPQLEDAFARPDVYWAHPVPRTYDDPLRQRIRERFCHYQEERGGAAASGSGRLLLTHPIIERVKKIEGWLEEDEADLLIATAAGALGASSQADAIVEVGSYCGRSTVALASVASVVRPNARVYAIDPGEGLVGAWDQGVNRLPATFQRFQANVAALGLESIVQPIRDYSYNVAWSRPIALLLIDGLHDYGNVARDFRHFEPWLAPHALIAFHDYADYYPGVVAFVNELLACGRYAFVERVRSLIVLANESAQARQPEAGPLVSCILPTRDRRDLVAQAIRYFLRQDYDNREMIVVDDGEDAVEDLASVDGRIRYLRPASPRTVGEKRNLACEQARGDIIAHWDDDDWMAARRLSAQVSHLRRSCAQVCGVDRVLFFEPSQTRAWEYVYPSSERKWVCGASLCYHKAVWRAHPFEHISEGEDTKFVWSLPGQTVLPLPDNRFLVALVHARNTSRKWTNEPRWRSISPALIRQTLGEDWSFYEGWGARMRAAER